MMVLMTRVRSVGKHLQRHLGDDPWQRLHQEVHCHYPVLDCSEEVFNRLAPLAYLLRMLVEPTLHRLEEVRSSHREIRRSLPVMQLCLMAQLWQTLVQ